MTVIMDKAHQVKVLARLTEEEALHPIFFHLGSYIMKSRITTTEKCNNLISYNYNSITIRNGTCKILLIGDESKPT